LGHVGGWAACCVCKDGLCLCWFGVEVGDLQYGQVAS
jgi:hypothetical protein